MRQGREGERLIDCLGAFKKEKEDDDEERKRKETQRNQGCIAKPNGKEIPGENAARREGNGSGENNEE